MELFRILYTVEYQGEHDEYRHEIHLWGANKKHALESFDHLCHNANVVSVERIEAR